jgi:hypothetical protein
MFGRDFTISRFYRTSRFLISIYHRLVQFDDRPTQDWDISVSLSDITSEDITFPKYLTNYTKQVKSLNISNWPHLTDLSNIDVFTNLETLLITNNYNLTALESNIFENNSKLKYLDVQNNGIEDLNSDALKGLDSLEVIKLGGNKFKSVTDRFFANAPNLRVIDWTGDKCRKNESGTKIRTFPDSMLTPINSNLEEFNFRLSDQDCKLTIEPDSFSEWHFKTLKHVSVTNTHLNYDQLLPGFARKFKNLKTINIEENDIEVLNHKDFQQFKHLKLKVGKNPYKCHCKTLNTLKNLRHNITDFANINCFSSDNKLLNIDEALHVNNCSSMDLTYLTALTLGTLVVISMILITLYQSRITCYNHWLLHKLFSDEPIDDNNDLKFDAYISYSEKDELIACNIYHQLIDGTHHRIYDTAIDVVNWEPGSLKATNIEDSIRMSSRTIALVSENYLNDDYCRQAFDVANRHSAR